MIFHVGLLMVKFTTINKNITRSLLEKITNILCTIQNTIKKFKLACLHKRAICTQRNQRGEIQFDGLTILYTDMLSWYIEYKDIFVNRIYHFETNNPTPYIIDGGGCIGMSALYFKSIYPNSKILCFEPDEEIFKILDSNIFTNNLKDITLVKAGLADQIGTVYFQSDGIDGGKIIESIGNTQTRIPTVRLSDYVDKPVDFLKLNIEGQELPVLQELENSGSLKKIKKLVIEYHGWAGGEQKLGELLTILERNHFRYLVHDFDAETCSTSKPPFHIDLKNPWFCLIYAEQSE